MDYLIGIDIGTSATKTVVFDANCHVVSSASQEYPLYQPQTGISRCSLPSCERRAYPCRC
ncbi:FGGY family carbohydrate kinase [Megasphaera sp.]|uniref:FGGY family carbohydrate kinase n=1 Tax=Megasphaera sp. TaxID=2023260 RepID=UPI00307B6DB0